MTTTDIQPKVPRYVLDFLGKCPPGTFSRIKPDNSSAYRFIFYGDALEVRIDQNRGIIMCRNPSKLVMRHAEQLDHATLIERIKEKV